MNKRLLAVLIIFWSIGGALGLAQNKFSGQSELFVGEMEEVFKGATDKKAAKAFIESLNLFWTGLDDDLHGLMISTCNQMAVKKARAYPDYHTYITTIMAFQNSGHDQASFKVGTRQ